MSAKDHNMKNTQGRHDPGRRDQGFMETKKSPESNTGENPAGDRHQGGKGPGLNERTFDMVIDNVPYLVTAIPFNFNGETRYRVSFNGSPEHIFTWDSAVAQLRAIDEESSTMPDSLETAISEKLK